MPRPEVIKTLKDTLMKYECYYGANDPRSVTLREHIEDLERKRLASLDRWTTPEEAINILWE